MSLVAEPAHRRAGERSEVALRLSERRRDLGRARLERRRALARERQQLRRGPLDLFEHDVRVGPSPSEGAHAGEGEIVLMRPRLERALDLYPQIVKGDIGVGRLEMKAGRERTVLDGQRDLDEPSDPRGALEVPNVGLDGAHPQRALGGRSAPSTAPSARASIGSPRAVPVPWAST